MVKRVNPKSALANIRENLMILLTSVECDDFGYLVFGEVPTFVAETPACVCASTGAPDAACIQELNLALSLPVLTISEDPDIGTNPGVVEHLFGKGNHGLEPIILDDPLADLALARTGTTRKEGAIR